MAVGATLGSVSPAMAGTSSGGTDRTTLTATVLRADTFRDPIGLGDATPKLSWELVADGRAGSPAARQTAYQIRVASTEARLGHPDLWDSGKVAAGDTNNIAYGGAALRSREDAVWDVRVWDGGGHASAWSAPGNWEMGLLGQADWSAKWIEDPSRRFAQVRS